MNDISDLNIKCAHVNCTNAAHGETHDGLYLCPYHMDDYYYGDETYHNEELYGY